MIQKNLNTERTGTKMFGKPEFIRIQNQFRIGILTSALYRLLSMTKCLKNLEGIERMQEMKKSAND